MSKLHVCARVSLTPEARRRRLPAFLTRCSSFQHLHAPFLDCIPADPVRVFSYDDHEAFADACV
eukprot:7570-Eustigmatos_ZCMA.PRE.1